MAAIDFQAFPYETLLETGVLPIAEIAELALREGQHTNPLYKVHRWFARRLGSQFRAILTGLALRAEDGDRYWDTFLGQVPLKGAIVLDPFVGGGTSLVEAIRCGARVIGYDIDPVATYITRFELEAAAYELNDEKIEEICASVACQLAPFHRTLVNGQGEFTVLHHFWVELRTCCSCGTTFEVHPHFQLASSKEKGIQWAFCKACHEVYELPLERKEIRCACGTRTRIMRGTLTRGKVTCPFCGNVSGLSEREDNQRRPEWRLFAQEYIKQTPGGVTRHFKKTFEEDSILYANASRRLNEIEQSQGIFAPARRIPTNGRSDLRPLIHGFKRYRDLFNERQLLHLTLLGTAIAEVEEPDLSRILTMAFSEHLTTNCVYTAYAFGYRRVSPLFSIHSYRHITRPVELNPWLDGIGRGTFPNVLRKITKAIAFAQAPTELDPTGGRVPSKAEKGTFASRVSAHPRSVLNGLANASISTKSSENLTEIPDGAVDLILTDPPYFDNVSYSELSDFYLAWHQSLGEAPPPYDESCVSAPIAENIALTSRTEEAIASYCRKLTRIFSESERALKQNGILVFTYHHTHFAAWHAVGEALARSGLKCTTVLPLRGEGRGGLNSHSGTIKWDAVFVCRKQEQKRETGAFEVVVPRAVITDAKRRASAYYEILSEKKQIAFREPDRLNLERAMIVAAALLGKAGGEFQPLRIALDGK